MAKEVWILNLIRIDFVDFTSPFTRNVLIRLRRYIKTWDSVSSAIQILRISSKMLHCALYVNSNSRCLDISMKHGSLSCLRYYMKSTANLIFYCFYQNIYGKMIACVAWRDSQASDIWRRSRYFKFLAVRGKTRLLTSPLTGEILLAIRKLKQARIKITVL